jgi:hypothetical protein
MTENQITNEPIRTRLQVVCRGILVLEGVYDSYTEADNVWKDYVNTRYKRDLPIGGCHLMRADLSRTYDVNIGSMVGDN